MGSKKRIEVFLLKYSKSIIRRIQPLLRSDFSHEITAEEILGEAVVYALEHPDRWEKQSDQHLYNSILWKCKRLVIDKMRRVGALSRAIEKQEEILAEKSRKGEDMAPSPTLVLHRQDKLSAVEKFLEELPEEEVRVAVRLVRIDGHTFKEAAEIMGKNSQEFRRIIRRGLAQIFRIAETHGGRKYITTGETS